MWRPISTKGPACEPATFARPSRAWAPWQEALPDDALMSLTEHPGNIRVMVVGGPGKHSSVVPSWGMTKSVTVPVEA